MSHRRLVVIATLALALPLTPTCYSQSVPPSSDRLLRESFAQFQAALARRDMPALSELLTQDAIWIYPQSNLKESRESVGSYTANFLNSFDLTFEIVRLKIYEEDGRATLVLRGQHLGLPKKDGKYAMVWNREPLVARWRLDGGKWRMYFMTDNPGEASAMAKAEGLE